MAIHAYTGLPGDGKSYAAVANVILPALKRGRRVVTNIALRRDELRQEAPGGEVVEFPTDAVAESPELIRKYVTPGTVFVLDEVWKLWPSGEKTVKVPGPYKELIAEHRHMVDSQGNSCLIVLVTQDLADIGAFARNKVALTMHHMKMDHAGAPNRFKVDVYRGAVTGQQPPASRLIRTLYGKYEERVYRCYKSHTKSESIEAGANETAMDRRGVIWKRPIIWAGAPFALSMFGLAFWGLSSFFGGSADGAPALASVATEPGASSAVPRVADARPIARPVLEGGGGGLLGRGDRAEAYRIAGHVHRADRPADGVVYIVDGKGHGVYVPASKCWQAGDGLTRCTFNGHTVTELGASRQ